MTEKPRSISKSQNKGNDDREFHATLDRLKELEQGFKLIERETLHRELDNLLQTCLNQEHFLAALMNCKNLLNLLHQEDPQNLNPKYLSLLENLRKDQLKRNKEKWQEITQINQNIESLKNIINIESDVAPSLDSIPFEELEIDNFSLENMLSEADQLLENHRVRISNDIERTGAIQLRSGKALPLSENGHIDLNETSENLDFDRPNLEYIAEMTINFESSTDDPIEEAFIEDIIPYNFEVLDVEINGKNPSISPQKHLRKNGLQLGWHLTEIEEKKPIEFKYRLRPRVSRTILVPTKSDLQVIHTHSSLEETSLTEGTYHTFLEFRNNYANELNNVLMEDIIPDFYTYEVEEKKNGNFSSSKKTSPFLVKWQLFEMASQFSSEYEYELTEFEIVEKKKRQSELILNQDPSLVPPSERKILEEKQQNARKFLSQFKR